MGGYIMHGAERDVVLRPTEIDKLIAQHDGDAALLYLCLRRADRGVRPEELRKKLGWSELRLSAAESTLQNLGLIDGAGVRQMPEPAEERPVYTQEDLAEMLRSDDTFSMLVPQTEEKLGKKLRTADLQILAGLYDDMAMPPDVLYLLVSHCVERAERQYGPGRRPTMRQIEKEGYYWARLGIFDQERAAEYLKRWTEKQEKVGQYVRVLGIGNRRLVESERNYILNWIGKDFSPELVALAYDKTIFYKKELNWRYLDAILRRWQDNGWRTPEDVERGDSRGGKAAQKPAASQNKKNAQIEKYMKW